VTEILKWGSPKNCIIFDGDPRIPVVKGTIFWIRETGTGQQLAQLHDSYMTMMIIFQRVMLGFVSQA
jgi:hypothetical protein